MIGEWMTEITAFAQQLVQVNSLSGFEGDVAAIIQRKMQELDFDQVTVDEMGNVIASKKGSHDGPVILFDGHIDVVEVPNPEKWTFDPFSGKIVDGKLYGRGAQDMKGPLAAILITLGRIPRSEFSGTMVLSCSVHEEKHEGAALKHVVQRVNPDLVVICEPNGGTLGLGQKGRAGITVDVPGRPAHSSVPHLGENAIYRATDVIRSLREMQLPEDEHLGKGVMELIDGISRPYPSRSTIPVGFFMHYDRRIMPFETRESVLSSIQDILGSDEIKTSFQEIELPCYTGKVVKMDDFHPGWKMPEDSEWAVKAKSGLKSAGLPVEISYAQFCTNGSYSAGEAGIPTIIFGPSSGMLAHCQDEYISLDELEAGARGYAGLIKTLGN